jgi:hypothetical protein
MMLRIKHHDVNARACGEPSTSTACSTSSTGIGMLTFQDRFFTAGAPRNTVARR